jgi:hypothetical protein
MVEADQRSDKLILSCVIYEADRSTVAEGDIIGSWRHAGYSSDIAEAHALWFEPR